VRAFVVEHVDGGVSAQVSDVDEASMLTDGDVIVDVAWSCLNFKDAMVAQPASRVARLDVLIGGVDAAGTVRSAPGGSFEVGDVVIAHGHGFGTSHHGGFAPTLRCDAGWLTASPRGLDARTAMAFGTAGYTAMASVLALEGRGLRPGDGEVLVTGASGGVGSVAVALLAARGYDVVAMSGKPRAATLLSQLGASAVVGRDVLDDRLERVLGTPRFAGAIDCVGGPTLGKVLRVLRWGSAVAASGLVGGATLETTVYPYITRNVALLGIDSVDAPTEVRDVVWSALAAVCTPTMLDLLVTTETGLGGIAAGLVSLERGDALGRTLVDPSR
jgi:acrylyl-CoA reductase (NADPH)